MTDAAPFTAGADHVLVRVRLTPNARDARIDGVQVLADGRPVLAARVRAVPEDGAANAALEKLLAEVADVAKSRVSIISGATQRIKLVRIEGEPQAIKARLAPQDRER